ARDRAHQRCHAHSAQRVQAAEAAPRLGGKKESMARYTGPVCRMCRRESASGAKPGEKVKLFLKGERCLSKKCAVERRTAAPGQKANVKNRPKVSEFGRQLREKQKMRRIYG